MNWSRPTVYYEIDLTSQPKLSRRVLLVPG